MNRGKGERKMSQGKEEGQGGEDYEQGGGAAIGEEDWQGGRRARGGRGDGGRWCINTFFNCGNSSGGI